MVIMGPFIFLISSLRIWLCRGDPKLTKKFNLEECIWFIYGAMMKQGATIKPISGKLYTNVVDLKLKCLTHAEVNSQFDFGRS